MRPDTIVGYTFNADTYCPYCVISALPTGDGEAFDGWALAPSVRMSTEDNLSEIAAAFGINRLDEWSFDSDYFPKIIFAESVVPDGEYCDTCGSPLID